MSAGWDLENQTEGHGGVASARTHIRQMITRQQRRWAFKQGLQDKVDSKGLGEHPRVPQVNRWVSSGNLLMSGHTFCAAVGLRLGTLPTAARKARGRDVSRICRFCGEGTSETLGHILQNCPNAHGLRIKRHDRIVAKVKDNLASLSQQSEYPIEVEPRIPVTAGGVSTHRVPDLVVYREGRAVVLDVNVCSDQPGVLDLAYDEKVSKYGRLSCPEISEFVGAKAGIDPTKVEISAITLNWRGAMHPESFSVLRSLGLRTGAIALLSVICLEGGTVIHRAQQASTACERGFRPRRRRKAFS